MTLFDETLQKLNTLHQIEIENSVQKIMELQDIISMQTSELNKQTTEIQRLYTLLNKKSTEG